MNIINVEQGTQEWLSWRTGKRMASETPTVSRRSPYQNWDGLRKIKRGGSVRQNAAMAHGHANEEDARFWVSVEADMLFVPQCVEDGDYAASLDGICDKTIAEIKAPFKGRNSDTWKMAEQGLIRPDYDDQIIHQLAVSGADICYFTVWDSETKRGIIIERRPDADIWKKLMAQWDEFWKWHLTDEPDPTKNIRDDDAWNTEAAYFTAAKRQADYYAKLADEHRASLIELAGNESASGMGIKLTRFEKAGSVDYKKALSILAADADIEPFRKASTTETRITIE